MFVIFINSDIMVISYHTFKDQIEYFKFFSIIYVKIVERDIWCALHSKFPRSSQFIYYY